MQVRTRSLAFLTLLVAASAVQAQGRADLRYVAPFPATVVFTTIDTTATRMSGLGDEMNVSGTVRTVVELRMVASDSGVAVTASLKELTAKMTSPMGEMPPFSAPGVPPLEMHIGPQGPAADQFPGKMPAPGESPGNLMGASRLVSALFRVPGRELRIGESWDDSVRQSVPVNALVGEVVAKTHGTYVSDTTVNGRILNVLKMQSRSTVKMTGKVDTMSMTQNMTTTSEEVVLWDSSLHIPVLRDATGRTESEVQGGGDMKVMMTAKIRSITTAEIEP